MEHERRTELQYTRSPQWCRTGAVSGRGQCVSILGSTRARWWMTQDGRGETGEGTQWAIGASEYKLFAAAHLSSFLRATCGLLPPFLRTPSGGHTPAPPAPGDTIATTPRTDHQAHTPHCKATNPPHLQPSDRSLQRLPHLTAGIPIMRKCFLDRF